MYLHPFKPSDQVLGSCEFQLQACRANGEAGEVWERCRSGSLLTVNGRNEKQERVQLDCVKYAGSVG
jgi:hypothetical protein